MVHNCRAEISPRPVSQDVHLCTTFYLYRLNHVAHTLQILCFCQQLVCFWGDKSRTDYKQPISVSVDSVCLDTLQIVIAHTIYSRVTTPDRKITPVEYELWFFSGQAYCVHVHVTPDRRGSLNLPQHIKCVRYGPPAKHTPFLLVWHALQILSVGPGKRMKYKISSLATDHTICLRSSQIRSRLIT